MTIAGSKMERRVKASDLRAVDRPLQCRLALETLKRDPKVLEGTLERAVSNSEYVGMGPGSTGFTLASSSAFDVATSVSGGAVEDIVVGAGTFKLNNPDSLYRGIIGGTDFGSSSVGGGGLASKQRRRKKKTFVTAEDGVAYALPAYVQNVVESKQNRSSLRLKMPLSGFLVNGEDVSVADLVVAHGLEVTVKNLLALR